MSRINHAKRQTSAMTISQWVYALLLLGCLALVGCSNQKSEAPAASRFSDSAIKTSVSFSPMQSCAPHHLSQFTRPLGSVVDLANESLPRGFFIASKVELLVEKTAEPALSGPPAAHHPSSSPLIGRVLIHERIGEQKASIRCVENGAVFGSDFDLTMTGLVKFETNGAGIDALVKPVFRQFFYYQNRDGYGVVASNPRSPRAMAHSVRQHFETGVAKADLFRESERHFVLRYVRESLSGHGARATLLVHLDLI